MNYAYSYTRLSTKHQEDGQGIDRQITFINMWLDHHPEVTLDKTLSFSDIGKSAYKGEHLLAESGLCKFLQALRDGQVKVPSYLLVERLDRLSRAEIFDALDIVREIVNAGVTIVTTATGSTYSRERLSKEPHCVMELVILFQLANSESELKSDRISKARKKLREVASKTKQPFKGKTPQWLTLKDGVFTVNEERAQLIRDLFQYRAEGMTFAAITKIFNAEQRPVFGITSRKVGNVEYEVSTWRQAQLENIARNPRVTGTLPDSRQTTETGLTKYQAIADYYPRIVPDELFNAAQKESVGRPSSRVQPCNIYRGLLKCAHCGKSLHVMNLKQRKRDQRVAEGIVFCRDIATDGSGRSYTLHASVLHDALLTHLFPQLHDSPVSEASMQRMKALEKDLKDLAQSEANLMALLKVTTAQHLVQQTISDLADIAKKVEATREELTSLRDYAFTSSNQEINLSGLSLDNLEHRYKIHEILKQHLHSITLDIHSGETVIRLKNGNSISGFNIFQPVTATQAIAKALRPISAEDRELINVLDLPTVTDFPVYEDSALGIEQEE